MLEHAGVSQLTYRVSEIFALEENVGNLENSLLLAYFQKQKYIYVANCILHKLDKVWKL